MQISQAFFRTTLWLALGVWVGSWAFFAFVVSRVAFRVLPGDVAGDLAGMLLQTLHYGGAALALVAAASAYALGRRGGVVTIPVLLAVICLASELFLAPEIAAVRPSTLGAAATQETSLRFSRLHGLSLGLFMLVHLASVVLIALNARLDARPGSNR